MARRLKQPKETKKGELKTSSLFRKKYEDSYIILVVNTIAPIAKDILLFFKCISKNAQFKNLLLLSKMQHRTSATIMMCDDDVASSDDITVKLKYRGSNRFQIFILASGEKVDGP
jgi:hypothetical protein